MIIYYLSIFIRDRADLHNIRPNYGSYIEEAFFYEVGNLDNYRERDHDKLKPSNIK